jgi:hypothetical protein
MPAARRVIYSSHVFAESPTEPGSCRWCGRRPEAHRDQASRPPARRGVPVGTCRPVGNGLRVSREVRVCETRRTGPDYAHHVYPNEWLTPAPGFVARAPPRAGKGERRQVPPRDDRHRPPGPPIANEENAVLCRVVTARSSQ